MTLQNDLELTNTEQKLADLEGLITSAKNDASPGRNAEVRSLTRLANELREEIARYKASTRQAARKQ